LELVEVVQRTLVMVAVLVVRFVVKVSVFEGLVVVVQVVELFAELAVFVFVELEELVVL
jgi:hypothetical protein